MSHRDNPIKDEATGPAALSKLIEAIMAIPPDAVNAEVTFGRRHESVGGTWYWELHWTFRTGSANAPVYPFNYAKYVKEATEEAVGFMLGQATT